MELNTLENELLDLLGSHCSKKEAQLLAKTALSKVEIINGLYDISIKPNGSKSMRASWVLDMISDLEPNKLTPFIEGICQHLEVLDHDGSKRNFMKILSHSSLPKQELGRLLQTAFEWLSSEHSAIAVRVHCMEVLYRISLIEPDITPELKSILIELNNRGGAALRSRSKRILSRL